MNLGKALADHWKAHGALPRIGARPADVEKFEAMRRVSLPSDFREYLLFANGTDMPRDTDSEGFCFWPIQRIRPITEDNPHSARFDGAPDYYVFADYLQWSWAYAIRLSLEPVASHPVVIVGTKDGRPQKLADTFQGFVELYLEGWEHIWIA
jgi:hypothetical protein